jgi:hypothetical protein
MRKITRVAALAVAAAGLAGAVWAQAGLGRPPAREPIATLYEAPGYQGRRTDIYASSGNLAALNFNDQARSGRFQGGWRICEDSGFHGRCLDVQADNPDFAQIGMSAKISSLQAYVEGGSLENGWARPRSEGALEGVKTTLFPRPLLAGYDLAAGGQAANAFCRSQGLSSAAYYDSSERARQSLDVDGRFMGPANVLRDVLCRR